MESEHRLVSVISMSLAVAFMALCFAAKGCNDSDNAMKKALAEKNCMYIGDGHFLCGSK